MSATAQSQTVSITVKKAHTYAFLSQPPPQKQRPTQALPSPPPIVASHLRRRANTHSSITTWATRVQPGSPAPCSPRSPRRRPSSSRRPSVSRGRRPSINSGRLPSGSFLSFVDTPSTANKNTPSLKDFAPDLTALGYTSAFVHLQRGPASATFPHGKTPFTPFTDKINAYSHIPIPPIPSPTRTKTRQLKHFRSLTVLKGRGRSKSVTMPSSPPFSKSKPNSKVAIATRKKAKYPGYRPPPLANELALAQFANGGSMEKNIQRMMEAQANAAGQGPYNGVGDVYRDGKGGLWLDQDEEWEYAHLLGGDEEEETIKWVSFGDRDGVSANVAGLDLASEERRGSVSTLYSDFDPSAVVQPADEFDDLAVFGSSLSASVLRKPGMSVLTRPSRSKHNHKPEFLLDIVFNPSSPMVPKFSTRSTGKSKPKGLDRRRPAPLALAPPAPSTKRPSNSPMDIRKDFFDGSFEPVVSATLYSSHHRSASRSTQTRDYSGSSVLMPTMTNCSESTIKSMKKKPSRMNMKGFFKFTR